MINDRKFDTCSGSKTQPLSAIKLCTVSLEEARDGDVKYFLDLRWNYLKPKLCKCCPINLNTSRWLSVRRCVVGVDMDSVNVDRPLQCEEPDFNRSNSVKSAGWSAEADISRNLLRFDDELEQITNRSQYQMQTSRSFHFIWGRCSSERDLSLVRRSVVVPRSNQMRRSSWIRSSDPFPSKLSHSKTREHGEINTTSRSDRCSR